MVAVLLGVTAVTVGVRWRTLPRSVVVAVLALGGFTAWAFASMLWADTPSAAWEAAARALVYLLVFGLFALWRTRGGAAGLVIGAWTIGVGAIALWMLVRLAVGPTGGPFFDGRLVDPVGYVNANAALWASALWPALVLAGRREVPPLARGCLAAVAVALGALMLLTVSRGALISCAVTLAALVAFAPGRARTLGVLAPVAAALAVVGPGLLAALDELPAGEAMGGAAGRALIWTVFVGLVVAIWAVSERRWPASPRVAVTVARATGAVCAGVALAGLVVTIAVVGDPVARAQAAWESFRSGGYQEVQQGRQRLVSGLGSNRYDFYRVAWGQFEESPVHGAGGGNFLEDYLAARRSDETPRYPHSGVFAVLGQTGLVGAGLLLIFMVAAVLPGVRALRRGQDLDRAVAGAALATVVYLAVHGSGDWLWAFPGVIAVAPAFLGLAGSLDPRRGAAHPPAERPSRPVRSGAAVAGLAVAVTSMPLWLADREVQRASATWRLNAPAAYAALDRAAGFDPFSARPHLLAATIALRLDDVSQAREQFALALDREPRNVYAVLELGLLAAAAGEPGPALALLERAVALDPRNAIARDALASVRAGEPLDVDELNARLQDRAAAFVR